MHVLVDLDVLVQGRLVDISQPLAGRIGRGHAGCRRGLVRLGHDRRPVDRRVLRCSAVPLTMTILPGERYRTEEHALACRGLRTDTCRRQRSGEMASVEQCRVALDDLIAALASVDPVLRAKHVPERTVACRVDDLDITFVGRLDEHGLHDLVEQAEGSSDEDVRVSMSSDELVALAEGRDDFLHAWLRGRIQVSASMRDLLRLRSLFS